jgi:ABC-type branched-subunit amino acid transport system ATPase component
MHRPGSHESIPVEIWVHVQLPVEDLQQVIMIPHRLFWGILPQKLARNALAPVEYGLVHRVDVGGELRFIGTEAARSMEHSRRNVPARIQGELEASGEVKEPVVAFRKALQALLHLFFGRFRIEPEEGERKIPTVVILLRRKEIHFRLARLSHPRGVHVTVMHMMGKRAFVVEELGEHRPSLVLIPKPRSDELCLELIDCVTEQDPFFTRVIRDDVAEPLIKGEITRALYGLDRLDSGEVFLAGRKALIRSPRDAIRRGIAMVNEDRKGYGLILCRSIRENIVLQGLRKMAAWGLFIRRREETTQCLSVVQSLSIRTSSLAVNAESLSGGNQQKVVLAKSLVVRPRVLILDEPTRGIDIGAKAEIHSLMSRFAKEGMAIIMISSKLPEIMGMADRILVVGEGRIRGEFLRGKVTQEDILHCALAN